MELYSRRLDFYSASPGAFFLLRRECFMRPWSSRGGRMYAFQRAISLASGPGLASILSQQPILSAALSTRGGRGGLGGGRGLPEWLSCRSIRIYFLSRESRRPRWRTMRGTGATADRKTRTTRAKLLAHRFISPGPPAFTMTFLLVSSLSPFDVAEIRLSNMHVGCVWWGWTARCSNIYLFRLW